MRIKVLVIVIFGLCLSLIAGLLNAQNNEPAIIEGRIIDWDNNRPLRGVHVFLSGTKIGTVTNDAGRYRLEGIPPGSHRLVISMIGYQRFRLDKLFNPGESDRRSFRLKPAVYELDEIYAGNLDETWEEHLERFKKLFLGESELADSVKIINPEVLRFERRWWGRFTAEALAPLEIEHRGLGYRIMYYLDEFYHSGSRTRWDGEPLYSEMTPSDSSEAAVWEVNRRKAFRGSMRHFFISMIEGREEAEGFLIYNQRGSAHPAYSRRKIRVSANRLIRDAEEEYMRRLRFTGRLEIIYTGAPENMRFINWSRDINRSPAGNQTSYLELNKRAITIDPDGEVVETYGATRYGYFSFRRVADKTPREYRPVEYQISNLE